MRVIGYVRLSAARDESTSIARQREAVARYAEARGWALVEIAEDDDVSATKARLDRPGLTRVRRALAEGEAEAVVVWRLDRLARSVVDFGTLLDEGVQVISATEPLDTTTPMGRAMAEILQVFAAMESRATAARVRDSVAYLRRSERFAGGTPPYGYRSIPHPDGSGRALALDPDAAAIVQEAASRILGGETAYSVALDLNARGIPTARGLSGWRSGTLAKVLTGDAVLGRVRVRGDLLRDPSGLPRVVWPPILTVEESRRLRALLAPVPAAEPRRRATRLLSGLAVCGSCGSGLTVARRSRSAGLVLRCSSRGDGRECEAPVSVAMGRLEATVVERFLAAVGRLEVVEYVQEATEPTGLAEVSEALQETAAALVEPGADVPALAARIEALQARRAALLAAPAPTVARLVETGRTFEEEWRAREGDLRGQRALLADALEAVVVAPGSAGRWTPERVALRWRS